MAQHAVILAPNEYELLLADQALAERVLRHLTPAAGRENLEAVANVFLQHFDPERGEQWGHVSYCICRALEALVRS